MIDRPAVYLDHQATTPCDPRVVEAMLPCFGDTFGNAASRQHVYGQAAAQRVQHGRDNLARLLGCDSREIVWTSGATEAINLALRGVAASPHHQGRHIVTAMTEHKAVLDTCQRLEKEGFEVTYLPVRACGRVTVDDVLAAVRDDTVLVSLMYANNEIGTIHPIGDIGQVLKERGVLFHCDAVQALAYLDCDVERLGVDLLSVSAHKIYGPQGVGALYVRRRRPRVRLAPLIDGGGHERGLRSGTLNVPGIVGFGRACELAAELRTTESQRLAELRDLLLTLLQDGRPTTLVNGSLEHRLPHNLNVSFPGVDAAALLADLKTVAVSSGSACTAASFDGSYVIKALPTRRRHAASSIRMGLGRSTTEEEVRYAAHEILAAADSVEGVPAAIVCGDTCTPQPELRETA